MLHPKLESHIFKRGSTTFFWSSVLFPKKVRRDVFDLYSFVRVADDYVDELPQNPQAFYELRDKWSSSIKSTHYSTAKNAADSLNERVVKNMVRLSRERRFDPKWVDEFLGAMESDLSWKPNSADAGAAKLVTRQSKQTKAKYNKFNNQKKLLFYIHGSAEVVGLMMARIMQLPRAADTYAELLGLSLQSINFIRDIKQDNHLGRCYFINDDFEKYGLVDLSESTARSNPEGFRCFVQEQIVRYRQCQDKATQGFKYIPRRHLLPIKVAAELYECTAQQIEHNPHIVYQKKVKPSRLKILKITLSNIFNL